ncbi:recombination mediator RecR [Gemella sanguinis]|jgi:recombination protein recR|uniref:Recombination protein RecR n=1 Tax=Gemella sanguinis TaxID=84135 RepID=A0ABX6FJM7_9BACL|nr:recombination mediator RecR [Gemella sanguinis]EGF85981.1 recombination protein RecR [Gemella sanguinis M325]NKZ25823.1 recombination protein RecR [Gemella sanguinis]QGS08220.1 recombination protein RecR [Gemella sanguinis]
MQYPKPILDLIDSYSLLPGIGRKTAIRLAFHTLKMNDNDINNFAKSLVELKEKLTNCEVCHRLSETSVCDICTDNSRDKSTICVVANDNDLVAMENMQQYRGVYHVLDGLISPMDGIGPLDINIKSLFERAQDPIVKEIILATNSSPEGEGTASFISKYLKNTDIKVTRIAQGISFGSDIEYVDEVTLSRAISGRIEI